MPSQDPRRPNAVVAPAKPSAILDFRLYGFGFRVWVFQCLGCRGLGCGVFSLGMFRLGDAKVQATCKHNIAIDLRIFVDESSLVIGFIARRVKDRPYIVCILPQDSRVFKSDPSNVSESSVRPL